MSQRKPPTLSNEPLKPLSPLPSLRRSLEKVVPNSTCSPIKERRSNNDSIDVGGREDVGFGFDARDHHVSGLSGLSSFVGESVDERGRRLGSMGPAGRWKTKGRIEWVREGKKGEEGKRER